MSFVNLYDLGSLNIPNTDGGKCLRRYNKKQTNPAWEEKRFHLVFCQSSVDGKSAILQGRPRSFSPNVLYDKAVSGKYEENVFNVVLSWQHPFKYKRKWTMEGDETEFFTQEAPIALGRLSPRILLSSALTLLPTGCVCACVCVSFNPLKKCNLSIAKKEF